MAPILIGNRKLCKTYTETNMMTLDEAIKHCEQKELAQASCSNIKCSNEHKQLANWLKELKAYRKKYGHLKEDEL